MSSTREASYWRRANRGYPPLAVAVDLLTRIIARSRVLGAEHVPRRGPVLVVSNHISHLDTLLLSSTLWRLGRRARFTAHQGTWDVGMLGWLFDQGRFVPVVHGEGQARFAADAEVPLTVGECVVVYPEGTIVEDPADRRPRPGAGLLASLTDAPVVPVAMVGLDPWNGRLPRLRQRAGVAFGAPLTVPVLSDVASREEAIAVSRALLEAIDALVPAARSVAGG